MDLLFHDNRLSDYLNKHRARVTDEIMRIPAERLTEEGFGTANSQLVSKYILTPPELLVDEQYAHPPKEVQVDVSSDPVRMFMVSTTGSGHLPGLEYTVAIPFRGIGDLFKCRPSTMTSTYPRGKVVKSEVWLTYVQVKGSETDLALELKRDIAGIQQYLEWVSNDISQFNPLLVAHINGVVEERKQTLTKASDVIGKLGIPVRPPKT